MRKLLFSFLFSILVLGGVVAFADDLPVATVNGVPYTDFDEAYSAARSSSGNLVIAQDLTLDSNLVSTQGMTITIPTGVTVTTSGNIQSSAGASIVNYGRLLSTGSSTSFILINSGNFLNNGGDILASNNRGFAISSTSDGGSVVFNGGSIRGYQNAIYNAYTGTQITINGGLFQSETGAPIYDLSTIVWGSGTSYDVSADGTTIDSSFGPLRYVRQIIEAAITWIALFLGTVVEYKLLLCFFIIVFVGLGIGLIKRAMYL